MVDRLAALMTHFPFSVHVLDAHARRVSGTPAATGAAHGRLYLVRGGDVALRHGAHSRSIDEPSLVLLPRPLVHHFLADAAHGADLVCANLSFEGGEGNPIALALPDVVCLPLAEIDGAEPVLALLFDEVLEDRCGRVVLIARLFEVVLIQVLRALMERGKVHGGLLSGLSHPRLRNALVAIHESPAREWTLDTLASVAGMSRSVFATTFRETVGVTPGQYLQGWRVQLAQKALRRGRPLKVIAAEVGYGSEAALSRAFKAQSGRSPRQWMAAH